MMHHNMSGSDEDLCWIDVGPEGSPFTRRVWLCSDCLGKIRKEQSEMKT